MKRTAVCACGQTSISVEGNPEMHGVCHCTNCKRRTGSAFGISSYFPKSGILEMTGEMNVYAFHHGAGKHDQRRHFCANCGTTLFWHISTLPDLIGIAGGCFADDGLPEPSYSVTHGKKEAWLDLPSSWKVNQQ